MRTAFMALVLCSSVYATEPIVAIINEAPMLPSNDDAHIILKEQFVLTVNGDRAGFINWNAYPSDTTTAGLYSLYFKPEYRDKGYGSRLMRHVLGYLNKLGYRAVLLIPGPQEMVDGKLTELEGTARDQAMVRLLKFYKSHGFVTDPYNDKQMVVYLQPTAEPAVTYNPYWLLAGTACVLVILYAIMRKMFKKHAK
jgi:GNAT superfamily N-acetyltransferase